MEANFDNESFGCTELCEALKMSRSHIHRKLVAEINMSISDFIKQMRLEKAKELLLQTNIPINEVAYKVGYSDTNYFTRSFSKIYGMPPSQCRQPSSSKYL